MEHGDFVYNRLFAGKGSFAVASEENHGCYVSNEFPCFSANKDRIDGRYLWRYLSRVSIWEEALGLSTGGTPTSRNRLKEDKLLAMRMPLPPLEEQRRIVAKIDELAGKINQVNKLKNEVNINSGQVLQSVFAKITLNAKLLPMREVVPITRRPVNVDLFSEYPELGIRSFGNGTFHKPALRGSAVGSKKLFRIEPGDLVFNNVFAWEGAVAVAKAEDFGRFGSHRFITCLPKKGLTTPEFLCFYFLTGDGLEKLGEASPGGAGRNRTLGLDALSKIEVPVPPIDRQLWFDSLQNKMQSLKKHQEQMSTELNALMPSILDKAFKGEL